MPVDGPGRKDVGTVSNVACATRSGRAEQAAAGAVDTITRAGTPLGVRGRENPHRRRCVELECGAQMGQVGRRKRNAFRQGFKSLFLQPEQHQ